MERVTATYGTLVESLTAESAPNTVGTEFSLPGSKASAVTWQTVVSDPAELGSLAVHLQASLDGTFYSTIDSSTDVNGEVRTIYTSAKFIRVWLETFSVTGATDITASIVTAGILADISTISNPFDQDLNTTDSPTFVDLTLSGTSLDALGIIGRFRKLSANTSDDPATEPFELIGGATLNDYDYINSGFVFYNGNSSEIFRLWASDPNTVNAGSGSTFFGFQAGLSVDPTAGSYNTGIGWNALDSISTVESNNVAIGARAMMGATLGDSNIAIGFSALEDAIGISNVGVGVSALKNTTGTGNNAIGDSALYGATGNYNVAIGTAAIGSGASTGSNNIALGQEALYSNDTGVRNTAIGYQALYANVGGGFNIAIGDLSLGSLIDVGTENVAIGRNSLQGLVGSSDGNIGIGAWALSAGDGQNYNIGIGYEALLNSNNNEENIAIGTSALYSCGIAGNRNIAIGKNAAYINNTGVENIAIGAHSLQYNAIGNYNIAIGTEAMFFDDGAEECIAIGYGALYNAALGATYNVGVGTYALENLNTGGLNVAIGYEALNAVTSGYENVAIGYQAASLYDGNYITAIGDNAFGNLATGDESIAIGAYAGLVDSNDDPLTSATNCIYIGEDTKALAPGGNTNEIVIGNGAVGHGDDTVQIGNANTSQFYFGVSPGNYPVTFDVSGAEITMGASPGDGNLGSSAVPFGTAYIYELRPYDSNLVISLDTLNSLVISDGVDVQFGLPINGDANMYIGGVEMTAPAAPAANGYRIYAEDNGAGKTRLMCLFATGAAQQLAIEP